MDGRRSRWVCLLVAVVYDRSGTLIFSGGITGSRGHVGDNHGKRAVLAHPLATAGEQRHDVFGCGMGGSW